MIGEEVRDRCQEGRVVMWIGDGKLLRLREQGLLEKPLNSGHKVWEMVDNGNSEIVFYDLQYCTTHRRFLLHQAFKPISSAKGRT